MNIKIKRNLLIIGLCAALTACGGSGSGSGGSSGNGTPTVTLRVTDAPINAIVSVVMTFTEARFRDVDGNWTSFPFNPAKSIDLLGLQGTQTADLLVDMPIASGDYNEIRLIVDTAPMANYVDLGVGGTANLTVPSGSSSGLKVKGNFSITDTRPVSLVVDFDLLRSVTVAGASGNYIFKPVLRLLNTADVGHIRGMVDPALLSSTPDCSDNDVDTFNSVYVFTGHGVVPQDLDESSNADVDPLITSAIEYDKKSMEYIYEAAFLPEGEYTIAFTCNADVEDPDAGGDDLKFFGTQDATVIVNNITFL